MNLWLSPLMYNNLSALCLRQWDRTEKHAKLYHSSLINQLLHWHSKRSPFRWAFHCIFGFWKPSFQKGLTFHSNSKLWSTVSQNMLWAHLHRYLRSFEKMQLPGFQRLPQSGPCRMEPRHIRFYKHSPMWSQCVLKSENHCLRTSYSCDPWYTHWEAPAVQI